MNITCLLIPILIGLICAILGYLLGRYCFRKNEIQPLTAELDACKENTKRLSSQISVLEGKLNAKDKNVETVKHSTSKLSTEISIEEIEGIGPVIGEKLRNAGIFNTNQYLESTKTPAQRKKLAELTDLSEKQILKFANMTDLLRIEGIDPQFAELLEAAGVDTVPELAQRKAENLTKKMEEVNAEKRLCKTTPSLGDVTNWVELAKKLSRVIEY